VYFDVASYPAYGQLSGNTVEKLITGARISARADKKSPADFALWKTGDPSHLQQWDSPWGRGYPGWHIECSAMSQKYLGATFDIHTGGEDNKFPHHENEIAQSAGATGKIPARFWLYNGHLTMTGSKLAKREGEQITLDTVREKGFSPLAFRLLVLGSHYRSKQDFSWEALTAAQENLNSLKSLLRRLREIGSTDAAGEPDAVIVDFFTDSLADDLNTPEALAVFQTYLASLNAQLHEGALTADAAGTAWATLRKLDEVLGLIEPLLTEIQDISIPDEITQLADEREKARQDGDFTEADRLRDELLDKGWHVEDTPFGPRLTAK
jgi:cysteinyl-tRNA synthetase